MRQLGREQVGGRGDVHECLTRSTRATAQNLEMIDISNQEGAAPYSFSRHTPFEILELPIGRFGSHQLSASL
jgi:hypothetical protein